MGKPFSATLRARFWPMTARPMRPTVDMAEEELEKRKRKREKRSEKKKVRRGRKKDEKRELGRKKEMLLPHAGML